MAVFARSFAAKFHEFINHKFPVQESYVMASTGKSATGRVWLTFR